MSNDRNGSILFERWSRFAFRHHWQVLVATALILLGLGILYASAAGEYGDGFRLPGAETQELIDLLEERFPSNAGDTVLIAIEADAGFDDPEVRTKVASLVADFQQLPDVVAVASPYDAPGSISADGTIARISVRYAEQASQIDRSSIDAMLDLRERSSTDGFAVEAGGPFMARIEREAPGSAEIIGITAAIFILLVAFGSVVAMGLPITTALIGLASGFFLVGVGASFANMPSFTPQFASMIGIGVGIDYALLIVNRFRESVAEGLSHEDAAVQAAATAGRSVLFAGVTVVIALLGLWAPGIPAVGFVGTAAALIVLLAVAVALVVLPAILGVAGRHIDRWRVPGLAAPARESETGVGYRLSRFVQRWPLACLLVSFGFLAVLAIPVFDIQLGTSDAGNNPTSFTSRRAYDLLSEGFGPGANGPILIGLRIDDAASEPEIEALPDVIRRVRNVAAVSPVSFNQDRSVATITVIPGTSPQDEGTVVLVHELRETLPTTLAGSGAEPYVGGSTALFIDVGDRIESRLPIFFAAIIGLSFLLLMAVFRSVVVPVKAAIMNLLSIGASFGVLVAIFQWGWLGSVVGVHREGPVESFLPMMLFAVLFGLSMDYEVFLVSRIREEFLRTGDNSESVARGLSMTTRVISAAAAIMVAVFMAFAISDQRVVKEFGIGLATAIFLDATVVRLILVPSVMQLMGKWNWWFPSWLDRIVPRISVDDRGAGVAAKASITGD